MKKTDIPRYSKIFHRALVLLPLLAVALALWGGGQILTARAEPNTPNMVCRVSLTGSGTHTSIQAAVSDLACIDIQVAAGTYYENILITRTVNLRGAGASATILDGSQADRVINISWALPSTPIVTITDLKIRNGLADYGGGLYQGAYTHLNLDRVRVEINTALRDGGGIFNKGTMTVTNSTINANIAYGRGGGIFNGGGTLAYLHLRDSVVEYNVSQDLEYEDMTRMGGGVFIQAGGLVENTIFRYNSADGNGAALAIVSPADVTASALIRNCIVEHNRSGANAGIYVENSPVHIDASQIISNSGALTSHNDRLVFGGGLLVDDGGVVTVTNSTIRGNTLIFNPGVYGVVEGGGIAIDNDASQLILVNTIVSHNEPHGLVMGPYFSVYGPQVSIRNSQISENIGDGINGKGDLQITQSLIQQNTRAGIGLYGDLTLQDSVVGDNGAFGLDAHDILIKHSRVENNTGYGVSGWDVYVQLSTVSGNSSSDDGGGISGRTVEIRASTITGNHTDLDGGGIYATAALTVVNSTVSGNTANRNGGGIAADVDGVLVHLDSVTIAENIADLDADDNGHGGGIYRGHLAGTFYSQNSIIADNQDLSGPALLKDHDCYGDFTSGTTNLIGYYPATNCTGFMTAWDLRNVDPLLQQLADNGGPTWTHALTAGSPAINPASNVTCLDTDQRGVTRDTTCDIGAYEARTSPAPVAPTLGIEPDGQHIRLHWNYLSANREVEIWRGTDPFNPASFTLLSSNVSTDNQYTDYDAIGDLQTNYFYAVRGQNASGTYSVFSNRVGEVDFRLNEEDSTAIQAAPGILRYLHFAMISLPLAGDDLPDSADQVAAYIDPGGGVKAVGRWNPWTRSWIVRRVGSPFGTPDFPVAPGDVLFLAMVEDAPESFAWVGQVPGVGSLQNSLVPERVNIIMVPLDQGGQFTMTADGLAAEIGGVSHVAAWVTAQQRWYVRLVGTSGLNFPVRLGYPYVVMTTAGAPAVWP